MYIFLVLYFLETFHNEITLIDIVHRVFSRLCIYIVYTYIYISHTVDKEGGQKHGRELRDKVTHAIPPTYRYRKINFYQKDIYGVHRHRTFGILKEARTTKSKTSSPSPPIYLIPGAYTRPSFL